MNQCLKVVGVLLVVLLITTNCESKPSPLDYSAILSSKCPPVIQMQSWVCEMGKKPGAWFTCSSHSQCLGGMICCPNGCGIMVCQFPSF